MRGALVEEPAGVGGGDAARPSVDELAAELPLELRKLVGKRRLRDVKAPRGGSDLPLLDDCDEVLELLEIHGSSREPVRYRRIVSLARAGPESALPGRGC